MRSIQGHVGESISDLLRINQEKMDTSKYSDNIPIIFPSNDLSEETFEFVYDDPSGRIHLPTARLIWFTEYAGVVTEVSVDTSPQKENLVDLYGRLHALRKSLIEARWEEVQSIGSYNDLQALIARSEGTTTNFGTGKYKKGNVQALIMVSIPGAAITPDKATQPAFVAELWFHDEVLGTEQYNKMQAARMKVNGKDISLPLSYWVK